MNINDIASAAMAAAAIVTTSLPSFAANNPPYIEITHAMAVALCVVRYGYIATPEAAATAAIQSLMEDGYTRNQIANITQLYRSEITNLASDEWCSNLERQVREKEAGEAGDWF